MTKITRRGLFKLLAAVPFIRNLPPIKTAVASFKYAPMIGGAYAPGEHFNISFPLRYYEVTVVDAKDGGTDG